MWVMSGVVEVMCAVGRRAPESSLHTDIELRQCGDYPKYGFALHRNIPQFTSAFGNVAIVLSGVVELCVQSDAVHRNIKPQILSAFGDIAIAISDNFEKYLPHVLTMLNSAQAHRRPTLECPSLLLYMQLLSEAHVLHLPWL